MKFFKRKPKKERGEHYKLLKTIFIVLIIVVAAYLILWQTGTLETLKIAKQVQKQRQISAEDQKVLNDLKKIIDLPEDIQPIMATIDDVDALRKQQPKFFEKAKNGDRLIVYPDIAILYNAGTKKIMHVGPVNFGQAAIGTVPFALYNGTGDEAKLAEFEEKLKNTFNNAEAIIKTEAAGQYDQTLVIDLVGDNPEINKIAESLVGQVVEMPANEVVPEGAQVLIIIGKNQ